MDSIRDTFHKELTDLKCLIAFYDSEARLLDGFKEPSVSKEELLIEELSKILKSFRLSKLQFNYNSLIISLYGAFERFVENSLISFIENINTLISDYSNLPDTISKNHFEFSLTLLNKISQSRYNGPLNKEVVIKNLHTCINTTDTYILNKEAFTQHTANFRTGVVEESFAHIGIQNIGRKILNEEGFRNYIIGKFGLPIDSDLNSNESFQVLNDLADYRNWVAHGVSSSIVGNDIIGDYLEFFEIYSYSLIEVLKNELLYFELIEKAKPFGDITDVFKDGEIVCFYTNNIPFSKGDYLIGKNETTIIKSTILDIQLDGNTIESISGDKNYEIGVRLNKKVKKNFKLYLFANPTKPA